MFAISVGMKVRNHTKTEHSAIMAKKKICKSMLYKVCRGLRNFGTARAKEVGRVTKTDPIMWMDQDKASQRKQYERAIELAGLVKN